MKPGLVYAILIVAVVLAVSLYLHSGGGLSGTMDTPAATTGLDSETHEALMPKPESGAVSAPPGSE